MSDMKRILLFWGLLNVGISYWILHNYFVSPDSNTVSLTLGIFYGVLAFILFIQLGFVFFTDKKLFAGKREVKDQPVQIPYKETEVTGICEECNRKNTKFIPENVVMGALADCKNCGEIMFFPSPQSPLKDDKAKKAFEELIKKNIH